MPNQLTPKEARILRKFKEPRVGVDGDYSIVQLLVKRGFLQKITQSKKPDSMVITTSGLNYLTSIGG